MLRIAAARCWREVAGAGLQQLLPACAAPAATRTCCWPSSSYSTASGPVTPKQYGREHEGVVADVMAVLQRLGVKPAKPCIIAEGGQGLITADLGFKIGDPQQRIAVDIIPSPSDYKEALAAAEADVAAAAVVGPDGKAKTAQRVADERVLKYAQAQAARRQLLASEGWVAVEVPFMEWRAVVQEAAQQEQQAGAAAGGGGDGAAGPESKVEKVKQQYLGYLLQHAVQEFDTRKALDHDHEHGDGGCGSGGCGHKH